MGEARRRGSYEERRKAAIKRKKEEFIQSLGDRDERANEAIRLGMSPFLERMSAEEWRLRRANIIDALNRRVDAVNSDGLVNAKPIRIRDDEIGWYIFLCEQSIHDPLCMDTSQAQRILPFFAGLGERWKYAGHVRGIQQKIDELLHKHKKDPDGLLFEVLVALAYAEKGWHVELLENASPAKSPDMKVTKGDMQLYVECKRLARQTSYSEQERNQFLRLWDCAKHILLQNKQWVWFKGVFHVDVSTLPSEFLLNIFRNSLPISEGELLIYDADDATIHARLIDVNTVRNHLEEFRVKLNSPALSSLVGGDWAPLNSSVTMAHMIKQSHVAECDAEILGAYVDDIAWACGFTRHFDSEMSVNKKAKEITKHLAEAIEQLPRDAPSIVHIAAETLEGKEVERRRTQKIAEKLQLFKLDKPVLGIRFHRFQSNQAVDKLYEFDETVDRFQTIPMLPEGIPDSVVAPIDVVMQNGSHWEIYQ